jgi:hypothetical protein
MIGYYVHHVGAGHLHRARALARAWSTTVTGLSSLAAPDGWPGPWVRLERDDRGPRPLDPTARGNLHWVPVGDPGLRGRMATVSHWIDTARPELVVSDVSVEVTLLARLHGIPVVSVVLPGRRGDRAHRTAYGVSSGLVAAWPAQASGVVHGLTAADQRRLHHVGGMSGLPIAEHQHRSSGRRTVVVMSGRGGGHPNREQIRTASADAPGWRWQVLGGPGAWSNDPGEAMRTADVVVVQAGQNAIADVAACRRPAVVIPAERPFDEQRATAHALATVAWPCRVLQAFPSHGWPELLDEVAALDGSTWQQWCDGGAAERFAAYLDGFSTSGRSVA